MRAVNLTTRPVELAPVHGPGLLPPAGEEGTTDHERELEQDATEHEHALARAGIIALVDSSGRARKPKPKPAPEGDDTGGADS
jgi:hypothetical protein